HVELPSQQMRHIIRNASVNIEVGKVSVGKANRNLPGAPAAVDYVVCCADAKKIGKRLSTSELTRLTVPGHVLAGKKPGSIDIAAAEVQILLADPLHPDVL